jgi:asparagine synthase (glutamine-hydrolysing)
MCGICGVVQTDGRPVDREVLERMNMALIHRGPDSDGYFQSPGIGLAMRRLAIIDLQTGDQPISNEDSSLWIVFNGEIFNFPELHQKLEAGGHHFHTHSDTECILHLYEDYGDDCVRYLNGQFAFAIWDIPHQRLLLARDRLGEKPLYYAQVGGSLIFSSELTSLMKGLEHRPTINFQAIDLYLSLQYIPDPLTGWQGVNKLKPAHRLIWQDGQFGINRYWNLDYAPKWTGSQSDLEEDLRSRLREAVRVRMLADVPLGAHLSGGIDSSIIVALMAESSSQPVETFSVGFEEQSFSELPYARAVSDRYGTQHHEFILSYTDIPALLQKLALHLGEPFADGSALPLYLLSMLTRSHVKVALNGDGGDDIFAGYPRHWLDPWADAYLRLPGLFNRQILPGLANFFPDHSDRPVGHSLLNGLHRLEQLPSIHPRASILRWGSFFSPEQRRSLWRPQYWQASQAHNAENWLLACQSAHPELGRLDRTLQCDLETYLAGDLLVKTDRMSMAASLEARSPFLDHMLVEWVARLPEKQKLHGQNGKYLLKRAFASMLPGKVLTHRKQGFGIPLGKWLRGPLADWSRQIMLDPGHPLPGWFEPGRMAQFLDEHQSGKLDHGKRIWSLLMLSLWLEGN